MVGSVTSAMDEHVCVSLLKDLKNWQSDDCSDKSLGCYFRTKGCSIEHEDQYEEWDNWHAKHVMKQETYGAPSSLRRFSFVSKIVALITRPSHRIAQMVERARKDITWPNGEPIIGLHVGAGESCASGHHHKKCDGLSVYMSQVRKIASMYKIKHIFLATDGDNSLHRQTKKYPEFEWHYRPKSEIAWEGKKDESVHTWGPHINTKGEELDFEKINGFTVGAELVVDMTLLAQTDAFVGKFTSNTDRAVLEISAGNRGCMVPFVSLDAEWCWGYMQDVGMVKNGDYSGRRFMC